MIHLAKFNGVWDRLACQEMNKFDTEYLVKRVEFCWELYFG